MRMNLLCLKKLFFYPKVDPKAVTLHKNFFSYFFLPLALSLVSLSLSFSLAPPLPPISLSLILYRAHDEKDTLSPNRCLRIHFGMKKHRFQGRANSQQFDSVRHFAF